MAGVSVVAVFQFYLPFVLPRTADWVGKRLELRFMEEGAAASVVPRALDEALFPDAAGLKLADAVVERDLPAPSPRLRRAVRNAVFDRLRVEVRSELASADQTQRGEVRQRYFIVAVRAANAFLAHARVVASSPDEMQIEANHDSQTGSVIVLTPQTNVWTLEDGSPVAAYGAVPQGPANASGSAYFRRVIRGEASFGEIAASVHHLGEYPDLVATLLLDVEAYIIGFRISEALLTLGTACEVASNRYIDRAARAQDPAVTAALRSRDSFATRRFKLVPSILHSAVSTWTSQPPLSSSSACTGRATTLPTRGRPTNARPPATLR